MIKRFILSLIRSIKNDVFQSSLNIIGLTLGFAAIIYISTFINHEVSFDNFHSKADRIYRVVCDVKMGETETTLTHSESPMALAVKNNLPEVEATTRFYYIINQLIQSGDIKIIEERLWYADENVFEIFDFALIEGNKEQVLAQPYSIVVSKAFGNKYLGDVPLIGKTIKVGKKQISYTITGVLKDLPKTSHLQFEALASFNSLSVFNKSGAMDWGNFRDLYTFILLKPRTDFDAFQVKFKELPIKYYGTMMEANMGVSMAEFESQGNFVKHSLQALDEIHLDKTYIDEVNLYGNKQMLYILGAIGLLILLIATFNFINLSTARASLKAKEVGVRKILGSSKQGIIIQVLLETFMQCLFALVISFVLLLLVLPLLNKLSGLVFSPVDFIQIPLVPILVLLPILMAILNGVFPALLISNYNPVDVIKGKTGKLSSFSFARNGLVAIQFVVFILLITGTLTVKKQLHYLQNHNPGFDKENVLVLNNSQKLGNSAIALKNELKKYPSVIDASFASTLPSKFSNGSSNIFSNPNEENRILLNTIYVDEDFLNTLRIKLTNGRFFTEKLMEEQNNAVVNKKAAEMLGWADCNNRIIYDYNDGGKNYHIIGIVEDFHLGSLKNEQYPAIIRTINKNKFLAIRIQNGKAKEVVRRAEEKWKALSTSVPFEYFFLDDSFNAQYKTEVRLSHLVSFFSIISIIIACFGLLGLISFTALRRKKEIGIRKINGARISEILFLLNKDFLKWVVIAFVFATPLAWYAMYKWLENFAYKTELSWWIFATAGLLALGIALITVSLQSWRAATRNPVDALRYE